MKKRLLIDVNSIVPYYISGKVSGIGRTTLELIQALNKEEYLPFEITLYSQNMKGIGGRNTELSFPNKHLYMPHREKYDKMIARFPIKEWFTGYNLMHIPHNFEYVHQPQKCIVTLHDALFMKMQEKAFEHEKMKEIVPLLMHKCKHIITCSEASKKDIVETMRIEPDKISVIYWGVKHDTFHQIKDKGTFQEKYNINRPYFFSVSCNAERKRTDILVKSYMAFHNKQVKHDLVLIWSNPPQDLLKEIEERGLSDRIHFISNVPDRELALLYNEATALLFPSAYEGFGLPILEAMACGTLTLTCRNSSLEEVGGEAAIYLDERDLERSMTYFMRKLENGEVDAKSYRERCIAQAGKFSWEKTAQQYIQLYQRLLNE